MPIKRWLRWVAWAKVQGPLGALADDYRAAEVALRAAIPYTAKGERNVLNFLPPWRKPSDYWPWVNFEPETEESEGTEGR